MTGKAKVTLPADDQILITREFDAPKHLVYRAWTAPELVKRWWSGHRGTMTTVEIDLRVGGGWRYVMKANGGFDLAFHTWHEPLDRIAALAAEKRIELATPELGELMTVGKARDNKRWWVGLR